MQYGCKDIKYFLDHIDGIPADETEFLNHIDNCRQCARLISLEPELEEILITSTPRASHISFEKDILTGILKYEKEYAESNRVENLLLPILIFFSALPVFFTVWFWKDVRSFFGSMDLTNAYNSLQSFISEISIPKINLAEIAVTLSNSPLIVLSIITIAALVWAFSIIEAQKALK